MAKRGRGRLSKQEIEEEKGVTEEGTAGLVEEFLKSSTSRLASPCATTVTPDPSPGSSSDSKQQKLL